MDRPDQQGRTDTNQMGFIKHIELVAKSLMMFQFLCKYRNEDVTDIFKEKLIQ